MSVNLADRAIPQIVNDLADVLEQGLELIGNICPNEYAAAPCGIQASSIGAHYRHHLEHVQILLVARPGQLIDYDNRERDPLIETDREMAQQLDEVQQAIGAPHRAAVAFEVQCHRDEGSLGYRAGCTD